MFNLFINKADSLKNLLHEKNIKIDKNEAQRILTEIIDDNTNKNKDFFSKQTNLNLENVQINSIQLN